MQLKTTKRKRYNFVDCQKYFLSRNIYFLDKSLHNLNVLRNNIKILKPEWSESFTINYIKSRYPDYWYYYSDLVSSYEKLSKQSREKFRVKYIFNTYLCSDIVKYIEEFI